LVPNGFLFSHHSRSDYEHEEITTKGTVVLFQWRNPHVYVVWDVKDEAKTTHWVGEMASVTSMIADGMTKDSLKPGDQIMVIAFPSKIEGSTLALIKKITRPDGTVVIDNSRVPNFRQP
jgi:hypothetical protein